MGKPGSQPEPNQPNQSSSSLHHFSHPHLLQLSNQSQQPLTAISCSACKLDASGGLVYSCTTCNNYYLHQKCSQMPQQITHPCDPNHVLSLLPKTAYPEGVFHCDACGEQGNGFSYHCQSCSIDLHILCASMPMALLHQSHEHQLNLAFSPPYPSKTFLCDLCKRAGSNHWLYRCSTCEFDIHLICINEQISQPPAQQPLAPQDLVSNQQTRSLVRPPFPQQPMYSVHPTMQHPGPGASIQPQFQQPLLQNMITRPSFQPSNPNSFISCTNPFTSYTNAIPSNLNPVSYSPFSSGSLLWSQPQVYAASYSATAPMEPSLLPMNNFMNTGAFGSVGHTGYGQHQNTLMDQVVVGVADGIASGASQAITGALIQDLTGGGQGGAATSAGGYSDNFMGFGSGGGDMNAANVGGVSHLQDFGGGVAHMNGYIQTPDVLPLDQGTYGLPDSGFDQNQMDAGIMAGDMNQMVDANQFDPGMVGSDMSQMQTGTLGVNTV